nr:MAG TPA: hypothetical protein [Caudoviricetes sp.]
MGLADRPDTLAGPHRKATPPQPKRAKIFLQVLFFGACSVV